MVVGVAEAADEQLQKAAIGIGANDRAAGGLDAGGVAVGVFVLGRESVRRRSSDGGGWCRLSGPSTKAWLPMMM